MKVLGKYWFTEMSGPQTIGIVLVELTPKEMQDFNKDSEKASFIGTALPGNTEEQDVDRIIYCGARFPLAAAEALMGVE